MHEIINVHIYIKSLEKKHPVAWCLVMALREIAISDLKGTMSSTELLTLYPPAPGFSFVSHPPRENISQI